MNKLFLLLFTLVGTFTFGQSYTAVSKPQEIQNKIIASNQSAETLQASFVQEKHMSILNKPFVSSGVFYLKQPGRVRWEYKVPFKYIVVLLDDQVSIKDGDDLQNYDMSKNAIFQEINKVMSGMVNGQMLEDENFESSIFESNTDYKVVLKPKLESVKSFITEINVFFDKANYQTLQVVMFEQEGDKTVIKFNNTKINAPINDAIFKHI